MENDFLSIEDVEAPVSDSESSSSSLNEIEGIIQPILESYSEFPMPGEVSSMAEAEAGVDSDLLAMMEEDENADDAKLNELMDPKLTSLKLSSRRLLFATTTSENNEPASSSHRTLNDAMEENPVEDDDDEDDYKSEVSEQEAVELDELEKRLSGVANSAHDFRETFETQVDDEDDDEQKDDLILEYLGKGNNDNDDNVDDFENDLSNYGELEGEDIEIPMGQGELRQVDKEKASNNRNAVEDDLFFTDNFDSYFEEAHKNEPKTPKRPKLSTTTTTRPMPQLKRSSTESPITPYTQHKRNLIARAETLTSSQGINSVLAIFKQNKKNAAQTFKDFNQIPINSPYVMCKRGDGSFLYFPRREKRRSEQTASIIPPISSMKHFRITKLVQEVEEKLLSQQKVQSHPVHQFTSTTLENHSQLWVDKYAPKKFVDLLSSDNINIQVLQWINQWKPLVFGGSGNNRNRRIDLDEAANCKPPEKKILLLCGPPGMGKTTLSHVIAQTAGYNIVEINASDERSGDNVILKINSALQAKYDIKSNFSTSSGVPAERKPILLVIDEIDGALDNDRGLIRHLVDLVNPTGKNKKKNSQPINRPIICICNDPFVAPLKPLRDVALVLPVFRPSISRISQRLKQICEYESLKVDMRTLSTLVELSDGDIRSSLHVLQFLSNNQSRMENQMGVGNSSGKKRNRPPSLTISYASVMSLASSSGENNQTVMMIGQKDISKGTFPILLEVLQAPFSKKREGQVGESYVNRLAHLIDLHGDYDRLLEGCFENYLSLRYFDLNMEKPIQTGDWIHHFGLLNRRHAGLGTSYLAYPIVSFHNLYAATVKQFVRYPKLDYQFHLEGTKNKAILNTLYNGLSVTLKSSISGAGSLKCLRLELMPPFLPLLILPPERFIKNVGNPQILKPQSEPFQYLSWMTDLMVTFNLQYVQGGGSGNGIGGGSKKYNNSIGQTLYYHLNPELEALLLESLGESNGDASTFSYQFFNRPNTSTLIMESLTSVGKAKVYAIKQYVSQKINGLRLSLLQTEEKGSNLIVERKVDERKQVKAAPTTSKPLSSPKKSKLLTSFFKKQVDGGGKQKQTSSLTNIRSIANQHPFWFKFNEGYSNAVRKPLRIKELI